MTRFSLGCGCDAEPGKTLRRQIVEYGAGSCFPPEHLAQGSYGDARPSNQAGAANPWWFSQRRPAEEYQGVAVPRKQNPYSPLRRWCGEVEAGYSLYGGQVRIIWQP